MRIVFIGCVEFSFHMLKQLLTLNGINVVGVITRDESSFNADFHSLRTIAECAKIPCYITNNNEQSEMEQWIRNLSPDVIYCFGWSYLLNARILAAPRLGAIGYHPTALPYNRGRHPLVWALALGLKETASTFFYMDESADSGDIISQEAVVITEEDDASSLYQKIIDVSKKQLAIFTPQLVSGCSIRVPQNLSISNEWRKRNKADGQIDWRMSSRSIFNLVRALSKPYVGAYCIVEGLEIKIWKCSVSDSDFLNCANIEPGKILNSDIKGIDIKCGEGVIRLIDHDFKNLPESGTYL